MGTVFCDICGVVFCSEEIEKHFKGNEQYVLDVMNECHEDADEVGCLSVLSDPICHTIGLTMECPHCENLIGGITAQVSAYAEWDDCLNEEKKPHFLGFVEIDEVSIMHDSFPIPININNLSEGEKKSLIIICKTRIYNGFCYIGFSPNDRCLFRPIYCKEPGIYFWPPDKSLTVGALYEFDQACHVRKTNLPHSNEDLVTKDIFPKEDSYMQENIIGKLYDILLPLAVRSLTDLFPQEYIGWYGNGGAYVYDGTNCPSVGVVMIDELSKLEFIQRQNNQNTFRKCLKITDRNNISFNLPWTSTEPLLEKRKLVENNRDRDPLVIIGLARGWDGNGKWEAKRCTLIALNMFL